MESVAQLPCNQKDTFKAFEEIHENEDPVELREKMLNHLEYVIKALPPKRFWIIWSKDFYTGTRFGSLHLLWTKTLEKYPPFFDQNWVKTFDGQFPEFQDLWEIYNSSVLNRRACTFINFEKEIPPARPYSISWSIKEKCKPYIAGAKDCNLCIAEKAHILEADTRTSLNSRSEMCAMCRHKAKFLLKNVK